MIMNYIRGSMYSKKIEIIFLQYIEFSDSSNRRTNERLNGHKSETSNAYERYRRQPRKNDGR